MQTLTNMTHNETNTSCPQNRCGEWSKCNNGECEGMHDCTCETPIESWEKEFADMLALRPEIAERIRTKLDEAYRKGQNDYAEMIANTIHGTVEKNGVAGEVNKD